MVDEETRLDKVEAYPGKIFQYNYSMVNLSKAEIDLARFDSAMRAYLLDGIKTVPELKVFRDHQVTLIYSYSDREGKYIDKIIFMPGDYKY